jgi:hypothetical protein
MQQRVTGVCGAGVCGETVWMQPVCKHCLPASLRGSKGLTADSGQRTAAVQAGAPTLGGHQGAAREEARWRERRGY